LHHQRLEISNNKKPLHGQIIHLRDRLSALPDTLVLSFHTSSFSCLLRNFCLGHVVGSSLCLVIEYRGNIEGNVRQGFIPRGLGQPWGGVGGA